MPVAIAMVIPIAELVLKMAVMELLVINVIVTVITKITTILINQD